MTYGSEKMPPEFSAEIEIEIPFHDADMMHIVWHGCYVRYLEIARCKLLDQINYNYAQMKESGYSWPIIDLHLRYVNPARFQQKIHIKVTLVEWENRLRFKYLITDADTGQKLTKAQTDQVAVDLQTGEMQLMSPRILFEKLGITESY